MAHRAFEAIPGLATSIEELKLFRKLEFTNPLAYKGPNILLSRKIIMAKYHISLSGKPAECGATSRECPRKGTTHYTTFEDAQEAATMLEEMQRAAAEKKASTGEKAFVHDEQYRNIKKMPALFVIDRQKHIATTELNEKASWIFEEPSRATIKRDGTSITVAEDGTIYARRMVKKGKKAPAGFIPAETDSYTGHTFGLEPVHQSGFAKNFAEAAEGRTLTPGTYELCGPKINGNPESLTSHQLMEHGGDEATEIPDMRTVDKAQAYKMLENVFSQYKSRGIEGVVWWGADGKRTKLRVKDFFGDPNRR